MTGRSTFGSTRLRGDRWQARWQDAAGFQHTKTWATKDEAEDWLRDESVKIRGGAWVDPRAGKVTFRSWSTQWASTLVGKRTSTLSRDLGYVEWYMVPTFGATELAQIDHLAVQRWVSKLSKDKAAGTVVKAVQIMRQIMGAAVASKLIASSPVDGVRMPRIEQEEMRFLTVDEIWRLHDAMNWRYKAVVLLGAFGGLRAGELFGLQMSRVDLAGERVHVAATESNLVETDGHVVLGPPKTKASVRPVPIPDFVVDALLPLYVRLNGSPMLFTAPTGGLVHRSSWRSRFWVPALEAANIPPGLRIHDLRHTAVSHWLAAGASPLEVKERAGHTSIVTVIDRYGKLVPKADTLTAALGAHGRRPKA